MPNNKSAPTADRTVEAKQECWRSSCNNYITSQDFRQVRIIDLLQHGAGNAITARDLGNLLGWKHREITRQIERERRNGAPILACGRGYYLPEHDAELDEYLTRLQNRESEIRVTRLSVASTRQQRMDWRGSDGQ